MDVDYMLILPCHTHTHTAVCAYCQVVCVKRSAAREACIYRTTWVHFRYLIGVVDHLAEDSTAHVLFSLINFCCFIHGFCLVAVLYGVIFVPIKTGQGCRSVKAQVVKWSGVVVVVAASLQILDVWRYVEVLTGLNTSMCAPNVYHEAFGILR